MDSKRFSRYPMSSSNMKKALARIERELHIVIEASPVDNSAPLIVEYKAKVNQLIENIKGLWG